MVKNTGVHLPSGQGALIGGFSEAEKSRYELSPKLVVYFALAVVVFIWILFNVAK